MERYKIASDRLTLTYTPRIWEELPREDVRFFTIDAPGRLARVEMINGATKTIDLYRKGADILVDFNPFILDYQKPKSLVKFRNN